MTKEEIHSRKRFIRPVLYVLTALIVLLAAVRVSLFTKPVLNFAKNKAVLLINDQLNAELEIGDLDGDLWKRLVISDISLNSEAEKVAGIDSIIVAYDILSLLTDVFEISELRISSPYAKIIQEDGSLNALSWVKESDAEETVESESGFMFRIADLALDRGTFSIEAPEILPDSGLSIEDLKFSGNLAMIDQPSVTIREFEARILEGRLPEAIEIMFSGDYEGKRVTMNELIVNSGRSVLQSTGSYGMEDSSIDLNSKALPLSTADIDAYLEESLPVGQLRMELILGGSLSALSAGLDLTGPGIESLRLRTLLNVSDTLILNEAGLQAGYIDLAEVSNQKINGSVDSIDVRLTGSLVQDWIRSDFRLESKFEGIRYDNYNVNVFDVDGSLKDAVASATISMILPGNGSVRLEPVLKDLEKEMISWKMGLQAVNIDLSSILDQPSLRSNLSFNGTANGKGFEPGSVPWNYNIRTANSRSSEAPAYFLGSQQFRELVFKGETDRDTLTGDVALTLDQSTVNISLALSDYLDDEPKWKYQLNTKEFDLSEVVSLDSLPTSLNILAYGNGTGFTTEELDLIGGLKLESSEINGAGVELLQCGLSIEDGILLLPNGVIRSDILDGDFEGRKNLVEKIDSDNSLTADFTLENIQPFAAILGVEQLQAFGALKAEISENENGLLEFKGDLDLNSFIYGDLIRTDRIEGEASLLASDPYEYNFDLNLSSPEFSGIPFQDLNFKADGIYEEPQIFADFGLTLNSEEGSIEQTGKLTFEHGADIRADIEWSVIDINSTDRVLKLQEPFSLNYQKGVLRSDSLLLDSGDGIYIKSLISRIDSVNQQVWLKGLGFDFGVLQDLISGERIVDGILSGEVTYDKSETELSAYVSAQIDELRYQGLLSDKVELILDIGDQRLVADAGIWLNGQKKVVGELDIPFTLSNPEDINDVFYDAGVTGSFFVNSVDLTFMKAFLEEAGYENTTGVVDFNAILNGTADSPNIYGKLDFLSPRLSGIPLDSLFMDFEYQHEAEHIISNIDVIARGQRAVDVRAIVPFSLRLPAFEITTPGEEDDLDIDLNTRDFNLAVFNDFLDKKFVRDLKGYLDATMKLEGTLGDLRPSGNLTLKEGDLGVPIAGIRLRNIRSDISINESGLKINEFTMSSNGGGFAASGNVGLEGIKPTDLSIKMKASQFKLANTREQNLTADLDGSVSGTFSQPVASGVISIRNGFIFLDNFGEKNLETIVLEDEEKSSFSPYDSLAMDMRLLIGDNFYIRNSQYLDLEIEMNGELELQKDHGEDLQIFGPLSASEGYVRPLGKRFDLTEGEFVFSGPVDDPQISVKTRYIPPAPEVSEIRYLISGTAQEPEFTFESEPFMEQQDIICYTFFGKPCNALDSWQQLFSGEGNSSAAMNLFAEVLLDEIEALATQELGIDVVQIDNTRSGSETGTSIKTGWYLNRRTFFAVINEITNVKPQILFLLEYMINERLDLILTQGDRLREGIDLRWQFDY